MSIETDALNKENKHCIRGSHRLPYLWESYTAEFNQGVEADLINVFHKGDLIACLERDPNKLFPKYVFTKAKMDDLNGIYAFLKDKGVRFKKI